MQEFRARVADQYRQVQDLICDFLVKENGAGFREEAWDYGEGRGGGRTRVFEGGDIFEKGGVNFSAIEGGSLPASAASAFKIPVGTPYYATGVSLVLHPHNPHVPTVHLNIRYFEAGESWWFGGGIDVTPYYPVKDEVIEYHRALKRLCEAHHRDYDSLKKACDAYFFIKHREEARGIGGLFFDHEHADREKELHFASALGQAFPTLYSPFLQGRGKSVSPEQRDFQLHRRSRYVEFNLIYDRGTLFGLQSNGRIESILMSMPPLARWVYGFQPLPNSPEEALTQYWLKPRDWASEL